MPVTNIKKTNGAEAYDLLKDSMGRYRTQSLFWENRHPDYPAPYTLKNKAHQGRISMYERYMEIGDPTEYTQAIALLGSWEHWVLLTKCKWFQQYIQAWREELRVKFESDRFRQMEEVAEKQKGTPQGVAATRWLAERYSSPAPKTKRGRPSKDEKNALLKEAADEDRLLLEESQRLGL